MKQLDLFGSAQVEAGLYWLIANQYGRFQTLHQLMDALLGAKTPKIKDSIKNQIDKLSDIYEAGYDDISRAGGDILAERNKIESFGKSGNCVDVNKSC